jgi:hypothetical protein
MSPSKVAFSIVMALVLFRSVARSQPRPSPRRTELQREKSNLQTAKSDQQASPAQGYPAAIDAPKSISNCENGNKKTRNQDTQPRQNDVWLIFFTGALVGVGIAQCFLFYCQYRVGQSTARATFRSALAAARSSRAATAALHINRPYIVIQDIRLDMSQTSNKPIDLTVAYRNFGSGPADVVEIHVASALFSPPPPEPDPTELKFDAISRQYTVRPVLGAGGSDKIVCYNKPAFDRMAFDGIGEQRWLAVYGKIRYRGGPKREYTTRFLWWNGLGDSSFHPGVSEALNARD